MTCLLANLLMKFIQGMTSYSTATLHGKGTLINSHVHTGKKTRQTYTNVERLRSTKIKLQTSSCV